MRSKQTSSIILTLVILATVLASPITAYAAGAPTIEITSVSETSGGLPEDGEATINTVVTWDDFTANATIDIKVYNSTNDLVATLETGHVIPVIDVNGSLFADTRTQGKDGEYDHTYNTIDDLAKEVGTHTYTLKVLDSTSGIAYDEQNFVVNVAEEQITLAVTWQDTNNDRIVDKGESVTFTTYVDWVFIQNTETHTIWSQIDSGTPQQRTTVSVTSGSGSDTASFSNGWNTEGDKTLTVELKDSAGIVVKKLEIPIIVGGSEAQDNTATTSETSSSGATLIGLITGNPFLGLALTAIVVGVLYTVYRKPSE
jgi:hypothetical protein